MIALFFKNISIWNLLAKIYTIDIQLIISDIYCWPPPPMTLKTWTRLARPLLHACIIFAIFYAAYILRLQTDLIPWVQIRIPPINKRELLIYAIISTGFFLFFWFLKNRYRIYVDAQDWFSTFIKIWLYWLVTMTFVAYFWGWTVFVDWISRLIIVRTASLAFICIPIVDALLMQRWTKKTTSILVLYADQSKMKSVTKKRKKNISYDAISIDEYIQTPPQNITSYGKVLFVWAINSSDIEYIFDTLRGQDIPCYHIADSFFLTDIIYQPATINNVHAFRYKESRLDEWAIVIKKTTDIVLASLAIIVFTPVYIAVAIAIKLNSPWPIFYTQKRVWKWGKTFTFIKFRSMYLDDCVWENYGWVSARNKRQKLINSDKNIRKWELQKIQDDPRVTSVGRFLRKTSLDELPNLFSVIQWTMSIIWPRPHMPHEVEQYQARHKRLLSIKPWITWYAQIHGRDSLTFDQEAHYDLYYIQHRNLLLDVYILLMTVKVILIRNNR